MSATLIDMAELECALTALGAPTVGTLEPLAVDLEEALHLAQRTKRAPKVGRPRDPRRIALSAVAQLWFMRLTKRVPSANCWPTTDGDASPRGAWPDFVAHIFAAAGLRASTTDMRR